MGQVRGIKKHPLAWSVAVALLLLVLWLAYFLATFDLNNYRRYLEDNLSTRFSLPVRLGNASLSLRETGLAVSFSEVTIGDDTSTWELRTDELWLMLEWSALLRREFAIAKTGLQKPDLRILLPESADSILDLGSFLDGQNLLQKINVSALEISQGTLRLHRPPDSQGRQSIELREFSAEVDNLAPGQTLAIDLTAQLPPAGEAASLQLAGSLEIPADLQAWQRSAMDLTIDLTGLDAAFLNSLPLPASPGLRFAGAADLNCRLSGSAAAGLDLTVKVAGEKLTVAAAWLARPFPVRHFEYSGLLIRQDDGYRLQEMSLSLNEMRMEGAGSLVAAREDPPRLTLSLSQGRLPLAGLAALMPAGGDGSPFAPERGVLDLEQGQLDLVLPENAAGRPKIEALKIDASLRDLAWRINPSLAVQVKQAKVRLEQEDWTLSKGQGSLGRIPILLNGRLQPFAEPRPSFDLSLEGTASFAELSSLVGGIPMHEVDLQGAFPFVADLGGDSNRIRLDLDTDLSAVTVKVTDRLRLPPKPGSNLSLHGTLQKKSFVIEHAQWQRAPFSARAAGRLSWSQAQPILVLDGLLTLHDATQLATIVPELAPYDPSGQADLDFSLKGPAGALEHSASLSLKKVGFSTRGITAPVSRLQGRLQLTANGFESDEILARIGDSAVSCQARMADFSDPELWLQVQAERIDADELIFPSDQTRLLDLNGELRISGEQIAFETIRVRMPKGTRARVEGRASWQPRLAVNLEITGEYADVEEIIGLWTRMSPAAREQRQQRRKTRAGKSGKPHLVTIRAEAAAGELYGMHFDEAAATIEHRPGQLLLHPLDFQTDGGHTTSQVIVDFRPPAPPLLRVSGHAENVDAYQIYNELLAQESILRGKLRGDFFLQGELGKNYLPSSYGSFDIAIQDGVLRKFPILSKIFSLLNVSQIFALELPDMNTEGMPFDSITGSLVMKEGVLATEGLVVESNAMNQSYIGEIDLVEGQIDATVAVQPLGTVDKIISRIPVAGWLLTGSEQALITTHFSVSGKLSNPNVDIEPVTSVSEKTLGLIRRTLGLPLKMVTDPSELLGVPGEEKQ